MYIFFFTVLFLSRVLSSESNEDSCKSTTQLSQQITKTFKQLRQKVYEAERVTNMLNCHEHNTTKATAQIVTDMEQVAKFDMIYANTKLLTDCQTGWTTYGPTAYCTREVPTLFRDAATECRDMGGYVSSVTSKNEGNILSLLMPARTMWIGLRRYGGGEKDFFWTDGSNFNYTNWDESRGEPTNRAHEETCVIVESDIYNNFWRTTKCNGDHSYFCKKNI